MAISTQALRLKFQVYLLTGTSDEAVEMASHIPALLDVIDTQHRMLEHASQTFEMHVKKLETLSADMRERQ